MASAPLTHHQIWTALDRLAERSDLSPSGLAKKSGLDPTTFNKSKRITPDGRARWPSTESIAKIIEATGSSVDEFLGLIPDGRTPRPDDRLPVQRASVPMLGFAQAGAGGFFDDAGFPAGHGWDLVELPAETRDGAYALQVQGDSMLPLYRDGDVLIVEPTAPVRRGDRVVVKTTGGEVMAKVLTRRTVEKLELLSINPAHPPRTIAAAELEWIARIVWASQ